MGLYQSLEAKGAKVREYTFWGPDDSGRLRRTNIGPDVINQTPFPWTLSVEEGDLGDVLIQDLGCRGCKVDYSMELLNFYRRDDPEWPILAFVKNHTSNVIETWHAQFVLGCDGPRSKVREIAGIQLDRYGDLDFWAMAKVTVNSDFPDIRRRCTIRSSHGNCLLTPCKNGSTRFVIRVPAERMSSAEKGSPADAQIVDFKLHQLAGSHGVVFTLNTRIKNVLMPFIFDSMDVQWVDEFALQKSLAKRFSDEDERVFLLGDACHVHSLISKQMLNGGLGDAMNLTWKLSLVLQGFGPRSLLATYEAERRSMLPKALELDSQFDRIFAVGPEDPEINVGYYSFEEASGYTSGCGLRYPQSKIIREEVRTFIKRVPETLTPGKRLPPMKLIRHMDGNEVSSLEAMPPDCSFTILVFIGELLQAAILQGLANFLASAESPLTCFNSVTDPHQSRVTLMLVHTSSHFEIAIPELPRPYSSYPENIFQDTGGKAHIAVGVPPQLGALCCIRPDGYIGMVSNLDDGNGVKEYLRSALDSLMENIQNTAMEVQ